jgi:hypothetical protein
MPTKRIEHLVFSETVRSPFWEWFSSARIERRRKRIRQRAETFINDTASMEVFAIIEHAPVFGPFSLVVWFYREIPDETPVLRASPENKM